MIIIKTDVIVPDIAKELQDIIDKKPKCFSNLDLLYAYQFKEIRNIVLNGMYDCVTNENKKSYKKALKTFKKPYPFFLGSVFQKHSFVEDYIKSRYSILKQDGNLDAKLFRRIVEIYDEKEKDISIAMLNEVLKEQDIKDAIIEELSTSKEDKNAYNHNYFRIINRVYKLYLHDKRK